MSLRGILRNAVDGGLPAGDPRRADATYMRRVRTVHGSILVLTLASPFSTSIYVMAGAWSIVLAILLACVISTSVLVWLRRGGDLTIEWNAGPDLAGHVLMTGPAETVYEGEIEL